MIALNDYDKQVELAANDTPDDIERRNTVLSLTNRSQSRFRADVDRLRRRNRLRAMRDELPKLAHRLEANARAIQEREQSISDIEKSQDKLRKQMSDCKMAEQFLIEDAPKALRRRLKVARTRRDEPKLTPTQERKRQHDYDQARLACIEA